MFPSLFFYSVPSDYPSLEGEHLSLNINMDDKSLIKDYNCTLFIYFSKNNCDPHSGYLGRGFMFIPNQGRVFHISRKPAETGGIAKQRLLFPFFYYSMSCLV